VLPADNAPAVRAEPLRPGLPYPDAGEIAQFTSKSLYYLVKFPRGPSAGKTPGREGVVSGATFSHLGGEAVFKDGISPISQGIVGEFYIVRDPLQDIVLSSLSMRYR
jgi:hypothetical protein